MLGRRHDDVSANIFIEPCYSDTASPVSVNIAPPPLPLVPMSPQQKSPRTSKSCRAKKKTCSTRDTEQIQSAAKALRFWVSIRDGTADELNQNLKTMSPETMLRTSASRWRGYVHACSFKKLVMALTKRYARGLEHLRPRPSPSPQRKNAVTTAKGFVKWRTSWMQQRLSEERRKAAVELFTEHRGKRFFRSSRKTLEGAKAFTPHSKASKAACSSLPAVPLDSRNKKTPSPSVSLRSNANELLSTIDFLEKVLNLKFLKNTPCP